MSPQTPLRYAIRFKTVGKYCGELCLALALLTIVPLAVSLLCGEYDTGLRYGIVLVVLGCGGLPLSRLRPSLRIQTNEAMVITALVFLLMPLLMTYPLMAGGLGFTDAFFEAVSAVTTTGLSTLGHIEDKSLPFLFSRAWMQWYGGLGIVVLFLAILVKPGIAAKNLAVSEEYQEDDLAGGTRRHARWILVIYGALTVCGILVLWLLGGDFFTSILYSLAAVSTGGFSPHQLSLGGFGGWPLQWAVILLCLASAVPLALYHTAVNKELRGFSSDLQLRALLLLCFLFTLLLVFFMTAGGSPWREAVYHAPLLAITAQTTAGFSTVDIAALGAAAKGLLILSMAIGGSIGSSAGGFKLLRLLILLRVVKIMIIKTCMPPHGVLNPRLGRRRLEDNEIREALVIILLFLSVVGISWLPFLAAGHDPLDSLFEVVSATGTVGLSTGVVSQDLAGGLKILLCLDMLLGRLEMVAWIVFVFPKTWVGKRAEV